MKCGYKRVISSFIDGELGGEKAVFLKEHLKECAACKEEIEVLKSIKSAFSCEPDYKVRGDFTETVIASLPERRANFREKLDWWMDEVLPLGKKLIPVPLVLTAALIFFIAFNAVTPNFITLEEVLLSNHFTLEEEIVLTDARLSDEIALELLVK